MVAFQTIVMTYKITRSKKPTYLAKKMQSRSNQTNLRGRSGSVLQPKTSLSIRKEGFVYRGITLMNMLDVSLRCEAKLENFKVRLRDWVKKNISVKPKPKFLALGRAVIQPPQPQPRARIEPPRNLITNYFQQQ